MEIRISFSARQERRILRLMEVRKAKNEEVFDYEVRKIGAESYVAERLFLMGIEKLIQNPVEYTHTYTKSKVRIHSFYKTPKKYTELYGENDCEGKIEVKIKDKNTGEFQTKVKYKIEPKILIESEEEVIDFLTKIYIGKGDKMFKDKKITEVEKEEKKQEVLEWFCTKIIRYELNLLIKKYQEDETIRTVLHNKRLLKLSDEIDFSKIKTSTIYEDILRLIDSNRSRNSNREVSRRIINEYPSLGKRSTYLKTKIKQIYTSVSQEQNLTSTDAYIDCVYEECLKQLIEEGIVNSDK